VQRNPVFTAVDSSEIRLFPETRVCTTRSESRNLATQRRTRLRTIRRQTLVWFLSLAAWFSVFLVGPRCRGTEPVIRTGVAAATQDKPQCKLWFAHTQWWAWLPDSNGSAVYARTPSGWKRLTHLDDHLSGLPGRADVWPGSGSVRAVLVGNDRLAAVELIYDAVDLTYRPDRLPHEFHWTTTVHRDINANFDESLETATICQDQLGRWWIAFDRGRSIYVTWTVDSSGLNWNPPVTLASEVMPDDICSLYLLPDRVGVIWSNQQQDSVVAREHLTGSAPEEWTDPIGIQMGGRTADDHLHCAVAENGTLFVASKNSVDQLNEPQQILRVRHPGGTWTNHGYATLTADSSPTRPIAITGGTPEQLLLLHTVSRNDATGLTSIIAGITTSIDRPDLMGRPIDVIVADQPVNNVTGPRHAFPDQAPWLVLASDLSGNVYEADLRDVLSNQPTHPAAE
jgi:hypothetical protein